jgi:hypothetical protein
VGESNGFVELRRLATWFAALSTTSARQTISIERVVARLGTTCVPLLGRELRAPCARRRDAAREALAQLAPHHRARVIAELRAIAASDAIDDAKAAALGLLAELGEQTPHATRSSRSIRSSVFGDPAAIRARCATALAAELDTPADVAAAAAIVVEQLAHDDVPALLDALAASAPIAAARLARELRARLDLPDELRARLTIDDDVAEAPPMSRASQPTRATTLVDADGRRVVIASRKRPGERRWRRWAVLVSADGRIADCAHDDRAPSDGDAAFVAQLADDGYREASSGVDHARALLAAAAARTGDALPRAYYVGRDLLELGDAHLGDARPPSRLARAVELLADGDHARARALLAGLDARDPDVAAALGAVALAANEPANAAACFERAIESEPSWPLHHWNLAVARLRAGEPRGCHAALCRFVGTSAVPAGYRSALAGDPDQPGRVVLAERLLRDLERAARLAGAPLRRPARRRARRATSSSTPACTRA